MPQRRHSKRSENDVRDRRAVRRRQLDRPRRAAALLVGGLDRVGEPRPHARRRSRRRSTTTCSDGAIAERRGVDVVEARRPAVDQQPAEALAPQRIERGRRIGRGGARLEQRRLGAASSAAPRRPRPLGARLGRRRPRRPRARAASRSRAARRVPSGSAASRVGHDFGGLAHDLRAALPAERPADAREQQPHVVVDLGDRADRRARVADAVLLADGDRRADAVDRVDVGLLHPLEELARVGRQRLDVAALPFGVDRVEGERRLARAADAGDDDQPAGGQRDVDVLQVVRARALDDQVGRGRRGSGSGHVVGEGTRPGRTRSRALNPQW